MPILHRLGPRLGNTSLNSKDLAELWPHLVRTKLAEVGKLWADTSGKLVRCFGQINGFCPNTLNLGNFEPMMWMSRGLDLTWPIFEVPTRSGGSGRDLETLPHGQIRGRKHEISCQSETGAPFFELVMRYIRSRHLVEGCPSDTPRPNLGNIWPISVDVGQTQAEVAQHRSKSGQFAAIGA